MGAKGLPIPWEQFTVADLGSQVDRNPEKGMGGGELRQRAPPVGGSSLEVVEMNQSVERSLSGKGSAHWDLGTSGRKPWAPGLMLIGPQHCSVSWICCGILLMG